MCYLKNSVDSSARYCYFPPELHSSAQPYPTEVALMLFDDRFVSSGFFILASCLFISWSSNLAPSYPSPPAAGNCLPVHFSLC